MEHYEIVMRLDDGTWEVVAMASNRAHAIEKTNKIQEQFPNVTFHSAPAGLYPGQGGGI